MKTNRLLRVLSLFSFLLLFAPFYDSCNGDRMHKAEAVDAVAIDTTVVSLDSIVIDSTEIAKVEVDTIKTSNKETEESFLNQTYEFVDDEESESAFEFAKLSIGTIWDFVTEFKNEKESFELNSVFFHIKNFCFLLIIIVTILVSIFSFRNIKNVYNLSKVNLVLLLITIVCIFLEGLFETVTQIKWGYYTFIIINLLIYYDSKKSVKQT